LLLESASRAPRSRGILSYMGRLMTSRQGIMLLLLSVICLRSEVVLLLWRLLLLILVLKLSLLWWMGRRRPLGLGDQATALAGLILRSPGLRLCG
jgi:hypothetical protein